MRDTVVMVIRRRQGGYYVIADNGHLLGGPYRTHMRAEERRRQIEYFQGRSDVARRMRDVMERSG